MLHSQVYVFTWHSDCFEEINALFMTLTRRLMSNIIKTKWKYNIDKKN